MNRKAHALLTVVALALIAADPRGTRKPIQPDDPAVVAALNKIPGVRVRIGRNGSRTSVELNAENVDVATLRPLLERLHNVRYLAARFVATDDLLEVVRILPLLEGLDLGTSPVTHRGLRNVRDLKNLRVLNLGWTAIDDSALQQIASLKALVDLDISATNVTDAGIPHLAGLTALARLNLGRTRISDKGLESISRLENLKVLSLSSTPISDAGIGKLSSLRNLQDLDLANTEVTDVGVAKLKSLHNLKLLDLSGALATEAVLKQFDLRKGLDVSGLRSKADHLNLDNPADVATLRDAGLLIETDRLRNVTRVDAARSNLAPADWLPRLKNAHSLTILELPRATTDADLISVCKLKSLKTLKIEQAGISDEGTKDIGRLTELRELSLTFCHDLSDVTAARLLRLVKLERLNLTSSGVTDAGLKQLGSLRTLRHLVLCDTKITDSGIASLTSLRSLELLKLSGTPVTDACLVHLAGLKDLKSLVIHQTDITDDGIASIRKALPKLSVWPGHATH